jgi:hypothetical protein
MDTRFNKNTKPNLFGNSTWGSEYNAIYGGMFSAGKETSPTRDVRYPAYAATMSDGRMVTDWRPQCTKNVMPHYQFHSKLWMINHATELMEEARRRQADGSGASLYMMSAMPPPAAITYTTAFNSELRPTYMQGGIGIERANSYAPELFGTFTYEPSMTEIRMNRKNIEMTRHEEGGRNSRARTYQ